VEVAADEADELCCAGDEEDVADVSELGGDVSLLLPLPARLARVRPNALEILPSRPRSASCGPRSASSLSICRFGSELRRANERPDLVPLVPFRSRTLFFDDSVPTSHHVRDPDAPRSDCVSGCSSVDS